MFSEFKPIRGSLLHQRVNSFIGIIFLATCALWAFMLIFNMTTGTNPITEGLGAAIANEVQLP